MPGWGVWATLPTSACVGAAEQLSPEQSLFRYYGFPPAWQQEAFACKRQRNYTVDEREGDVTRTMRGARVVGDCRKLSLKKRASMFLG